MSKLRRPRGAVATRLFPQIDPTADEGRARAFRTGAEECFICAKRLNAAFPNLTGEYILTFHALELGLKAFLAGSGLSNDKLRTRPFRHNLMKLYEEACKCGLSISQAHAEATIEWINEYHDKDALLRYDFTQLRELPMGEAIFPIVEAILAASKEQAAKDTPHAPHEDQDRG